MTEKLSQKNINLIFAVTENVVSLYQVTVPSGISGVGSVLGGAVSGNPGTLARAMLPNRESPSSSLFPGANGSFLWSLSSNLEPHGMGVLVFVVLEGSNLLGERGVRSSL